MGTRRHLGSRVSTIAFAVIALSSRARAQPDDYGGDDGDDSGDYETPTQVDHVGGFVWTTADEDYQLRVGGFLQARWELDRAGDDRTTGFALRRARPVIDGTGEHGLGFHLMGELVDPALLEGYLEWREGWVGVRAGKDRVPFLRSGVMPEDQYAFGERAVVTEAYGWDRDVGVEVRFRPTRLPVSAVVMVANGGPDATPDDVPMVAVRLQMTPIGPKPDPGAGDRVDTRFIGATLGVNVAVDAVAAPGALGDMALTNDVDGDGKAELVTTISNAVDLTLRHRGLELAVEGVMRIERWGDLLAANPALTDLGHLDMTAGGQTYTAGSAELTYLFHDVMLGARVAGGEVPFLSTHGPTAIPLGRTVFETDGVLGYYRNGTRLVGVTYRYLNYGDRYEGGDGPIEHCVIAEAQVVL